jgi:uncharacterized protein (TIGR03435 family)
VFRGIQLAVLTSCLAWSELAWPQPAFDVATIKPAALARVGGEGSLAESVQISPLAVTMRNVSLSDCLQWAYRLKDYQVTGPSWTGSERWDLFARAGSPSREDELRVMMQTLLAERFHLAFHHERKEAQVYALLEGREPHLQKSQDETPESMNLVRPGLRIAFRHYSVTKLADLLSSLLVIGRPVIDETGIEGFFDFQLDLRELRLPDDVEPGPTPSSVLERQIGLRLESRKAALELLVVDRAERIPIAN